MVCHLSRPPHSCKDLFHFSFVLSMKIENVRNIDALYYSYDEFLRDNVILHSINLTAL